MHGAMRADRDRSPSRSARQTETRWPTKVATRTSDGSPAGRPAERRPMHTPDGCGHVMPLRSRSSASTDSTGATRIAMVIGAVVVVVHVANLRALVWSPPERMSWVDGSASAEPQHWPAGYRALAVDPVDPEVGDPLVDDLPPGHPGQPEAFTEVWTARGIHGGLIRRRSGVETQLRRDQVERDLPELQAHRRRAGCVGAPTARRRFSLPHASPRLDKLLGWLVTRLD
jgi:hypothetical protein